ncbi:hypothetical protein NPIL_125611 [Nephila pilipes]|uniref:Uncharacterized protein n=1 Tax=Nephila pilipes TaxID=299642 RepID=A0A8X6MVA2_NEPPI|nr:hypothetical protein NPIL_125611 [Nephila pilipes]
MQSKIPWRETAPDLFPLLDVGDIPLNCSEFTWDMVREVFLIKPGKEAEKFSSNGDNRGTYNENEIGCRLPDSPFNDIRIK